MATSRKLDLPSLLIMPIQRLPRYLLLLEDLHRETAPDHSDFPDLSKSIKILKQVADEMNNAVKQAENINKILDIQNSLNSKIILLTPSRNWIREGQTTVSNIKDSKKITGVVYLFNDMILLIRKALLIQASSLEEQLLLDTCTIQDMPDTGVSPNSFQVATGKKTFTLSFKTLGEKNSWITDISKCMANRQDIIGRDFFKIRFGDSNQETTKNKRHTSF